MVLCVGGEEKSTLGISRLTKIVFTILGADPESGYDSQSTLILIGNTVSRANTWGLRWFSVLVEK